MPPPSCAASGWINETSKLHFRGGALFLVGRVDSSPYEVFICAAITFGLGLITLDGLLEVCLGVV